MAEVLAEAQDVEAVWRPLTSQQERNRADHLCMVASAALRVPLPDVDARMADGRLNVALVRAVVAGIVKRAMENPRNANSVSQTTGPYTTSETYSTAMANQASSLNINITEGDLALLRGRTGFSVPGTIRTRSPWSLSW